MRKLKLQVQVSVDCFVAGPDGEMDWKNAFDCGITAQHYQPVKP